MLIRRNQILAIKRQNICAIFRTDNCAMRELYLLQGYERVQLVNAKHESSYAIAKAFNRRILIHTNLIRFIVSLIKSALMRRFICDEFNSGELNGSAATTRLQQDDYKY